jgi:hypothetical protein
VARNAKKLREQKPKEWTSWNFGELLLPREIPLPVDVLREE